MLVLIALAGGGFYLYQTGFWRKVSFGQYQGYNVLLITLDTVRADHLPAYGYRGVTTPNLDRLTKDGMIFQNAIAHVPLTLPSHTSIFTGKLPVGHGVRDNSGYFLDPSETTIAEVFKKAGYSTAGFVSAFVLDRTWQINQGFDHFYDNFNPAEFGDLNPKDVQRRAEETEAEVERWLDQNGSGKFFAWVHYYDPHDPYDPPEPYRTQYGASLYDGEIAYTDDVLGRLLDKLEQMNVADRTIIVVTGDHGEGLGEHQEPTHGIFLYDTTLHVPLILSLPNGRSKIVKPLVRHIDLAPTILELTGIQPPPSMQGKSMLQLINDDEKKERLAASESIYAELHYGWSPLSSMRSVQYKYIEAPNAELYQVDVDRSEKNNLIQQKQSISRVLKTELAETISASARKNLEGPKEVDPEIQESLAALGYISPSVTSTEASRKIDPKEKVHLANAIQYAAAAAMQENFREALRLLQPVFAERAVAGVEAHLTAGVSYAGIGDYQKAIDQFLETLRLRPDFIRAMYNLAYAYHLTNDAAKAEFWYKKILENDPNHLHATTKLASLYRVQNRMEEANALFEKVLAKYNEHLQKATSAKGRTSLFASIAEVQFLSGRLPDAEQSLKSAISLQPDAPGLHYNLAQVQEALGKQEDALSEYQKETRTNPSNFKAFHNIGMIYAERKQYDQAVESFQRAIDLNPQDGRAYWMLASVYKLQGKEDEANRILSFLRQGK